MRTAAASPDRCGILAHAKRRAAFTISRFLESSRWLTQYILVGWVEGSATHLVGNGGLRCAPPTLQNVNSYPRHFLQCRPERIARAERAPFLRQIDHQREPMLGRHGH